MMGQETIELSPVLQEILRQKHPNSGHIFLLTVGNINAFIPTGEKLCSH